MVIKMKYLVIFLIFICIIIEIGKFEYEFLGSVVNWCYFENDEVGLK